MMSIFSPLFQRASAGTQNRNVLCWFCGEFTADPIYGIAIGQMVYSSFIRVSKELASGDTEETLPCHIESVGSPLCICQQCVIGMRERTGDLPDAYITQQMSNLEDQRAECADTDTWLIPWEEKKYPFGCWLECFPDIGIQQKFYALPFAELYCRGLRLKGEIWLDGCDAQQFLERNDQGKSTATLPSGFEEHVKSAIHVDDPDFARNLASVRGVVYDISVYSVFQDSW